MPFSKESALELLLGARREGRLAHAHLITGAPGAGKAWLAHRLAADVLSCDPQSVLAHPDAHFVYPESKSRRIVIGQIRELENAIQRKPLLGSAKVAIIGDADRLQPAAANAFLKTLEEPPPGTIMILTSSLPEAILETVLSRCVETSLHGGDDGPDADGLKILDALGEFLARPSAPTVADAFRLARTVQEILAGVRERVADEHAAALKEEAKRYKNIVGTEAWLEEREEQIKALAEATALRERDRLIGCVLHALGGALRVLHGGTSLHPACEALAAKYSEQHLLAMIEAWETLRRRLALNLNEALTLETGFLAIARPR